MAQSGTANAESMNAKCRRYDARGAVRQTVNEIRTVSGSYGFALAQTVSVTGRT